MSCLYHGLAGLLYAGVVYTGELALVIERLLKATLMVHDIDPQSRARVGFNTSCCFLSIYTVCLCPLPYEPSSASPRTMGLGTLTSRVYSALRCKIVAPDPLIAVLVNTPTMRGIRA